MRERAYLAARGLPLLSRQLNSRGVMSPFTAQCTRSRCKGGGNDLSALAVIGILRITGCWNRDAQRSKRVAKERDTFPFPTLSERRPSVYITHTPRFREPFFLLLIPAGESISRAHDSNEIEIRAGVTRGFEGDEKRGSVISSSNWFLQAGRPEGRDGGGFNILIKTTRGFVVGVDEG